MVVLGPKIFIVIVHGIGVLTAAAAIRRVFTLIKKAADTFFLRMHLRQNTPVNICHIILCKQNEYDERTFKIRGKFWPMRNLGFQNL